MSVTSDDVRARPTSFLSFMSAGSGHSHKYFTITPLPEGQYQHKMSHIALCCLEGSIMSNLVHRRRRCARIDLHDSAAWRAVRQRTGKVYPCLSPCDGCKSLGGVMVWLTENIQACLRIFRRTQHQWLARDILHPSQGVFAVFV